MSGYEIIRRPCRGILRAAACAAVVVLFGAALAPAAHAGCTTVAGCQDLADAGSHTVGVTWQTTAEQPDHELLLDNTVDTGADWETVDAAIADGTPKSYPSTGGWPPAGAAMTYRVTALHASRLEEAGSVSCVPQTAAAAAPAAGTQPLALSAAGARPAPANAQVAEAAEVQPDAAQAGRQPVEVAAKSGAGSPAAGAAPVAAGLAAVEARPGAATPTSRKPPGVAGAVAALGALIGGAVLLVWRCEAR